MIINIKSELGQKVRKAVKSKLVELGVYADEELPDYIMVMLANKKTDEQMKEDLSLFLNERTESFVAWLKEALSKLTTEEKVKDIDKAKPKPSQKADSAGKNSSEPVESVEKATKRKASTSNENKPTDSKRPKTSNSRIMSSVGAVINREEDDSISHNHRSVASTVHVTERKSSVSTRLQANTALLVKAMKAAANDTSEVVQRPVVKEAAIEVNETSVRPVVKAAASDLADSSHRSVDKEALLKDLRYTITQKKKLKQQIDNGDGCSTDEGDDAVEIRKLLYPATSTNEKKFNTTELRKIIKAVQQTPPKVKAIDKEQDDSDNSPETKCENSVMPRFYVTLDGVDEKLSKSFLAEEEASTKSPTETKLEKMERCKFWPNCKNKTTCSYVHPTEPCKTFPNCSFGERCLYVHPYCKYDALCTKPSCPFTHANRPKLMPQVVQPQLILAPAVGTFPPLPYATVPCRFGKHCTNLSCTFAHPKPCKFGAACLYKQSCPFMHQTPSPAVRPTDSAADRFKWSSSSVKNTVS